MTGMTEQALSRTRPWALILFHSPHKPFSEIFLSLFLKGKIDEKNHSFTSSVPLIVFCLMLDHCIISYIQKVSSNETQLYSPRTWYPILPFPFNSPSPLLHEPQLSQVILVQRIISSEGRQQTIQAKTNDWTLKVTAKSMQTTDLHFCFLSEHQQFVQMSVS